MANECSFWGPCADDTKALGVCTLDESIDCPPVTPESCAIARSHRCANEGTRLSGGTDADWYGCMLEYGTCRGQSCSDFAPVLRASEPAVHTKSGPGPDGAPDVGAESGSGGDASTTEAPTMDVLPDPDVPALDSAAPCDDSGPEIAHLVTFMARQLFDAGRKIPAPAVVCRKSYDGRCASPCALGNFSRSLYTALQKMPEARIISPD
jgi:hypothetical protein